MSMERRLLWGGRIVSVCGDCPQRVGSAVDEPLNFKSRAGNHMKGEYPLRLPIKESVFFPLGADSA